LAGARFLIETEVNTASDSRLIDIVGDLFERCVMENRFGHRRLLRVIGGRPCRTLSPALRAQPRQDWRARTDNSETRRKDQWHPLRIWIRLRLPSASAARIAVWAPQIEMVFRFKTRDRSIPYRHRKQRKDSNVLRKCLP
jgi:hypothetical protein